MRTVEDDVKEFYFSRHYSVVRQELYALTHTLQTRVLNLNAEDIRLPYILSELKGAQKLVSLLEERKAVLQEEDANPNLRY